MHPTAATGDRRAGRWLGRRPARHGVLWTLLLLAAVQIAFWSAKEFTRPELRITEPDPARAGQLVEAMLARGIPFWPGSLYYYIDKPSIIDQLGCNTGDAMVYDGGNCGKRAADTPHGRHLFCRRHHSIEVSARCPPA